MSISIDYSALSDQDIVLDDLPEDVVASIETRDRYLANLGMDGTLGFEFVVDDLKRWRPGQSVRVAFNGGSTDLRRDIAQATQPISDACNLTLDFGDPDNGGFREWSATDTEYKGEIRLSFDQKGYFSLVGTDSTNAIIGSPTGAVGGRPGQLSLNLGGFKVSKPATWRRTVLHEFLHALGFHHAHQNMRGPCQSAFRWDDDPGYAPTQNQSGGYIPDSNGRRPGIYTYLSGYPNHWSKTKVDHNLKTEDDPRVVAGPFDRHSVMLYRFPDSFYKTNPSPCAPAGDGQTLSDDDIRGLQLLYPFGAGEVQDAVNSMAVLADGLSSFTDAADVAFESTEMAAATAASPYVQETAATLKRCLAD